MFAMMLLRAMIIIECGVTVCVVNIKMNMLNPRERARHEYVTLVK